jgi:glutathione synthase/RimK-type ligase-like ATP-grasp enzyme
VLLATCADLPSGDEDAGALGAALAALGVSAEWAVWTDPARDWQRGLTVLRSTWDYAAARESFLKWARGVTELANPYPVVEWNSDKTYLRDLDRAGVPIVPTTWATPGEAVVVPESGEFVVKPSVGAGSRGAGRFTADAGDRARVHAAQLHDAGRIVLVQPYLSGVDTEGETALVYLDGQFSHAVRKGAMLPEGVAHPVDGHDLYVAERIESTQAGDDELKVGEQAMAFVERRFGGPLLYARVDLLPSDAGPVLVELELTEPSLFLGHAGGAAQRFAAAIARRVR